jgi:Kef-type K+ transport system membrane component KefB
VNTSVNQAEVVLFNTLLQLIVMVGAARGMHVVFRRLGQPGVIGEIIAGLILGPSLAGHFFPHLSVELFGERASTPITVISQIGLIFLMFQIGLDFNFGHLNSQRNRRAVIAITVVSIAVPLAVGVGLGQLSASTFVSEADSWRYSLFFGLGLAITAVPILGRILRQYGLTQTELGVVAISAAAINDVIGWILLSILSAYAVARLSIAHTVAQVMALGMLALVLWYVLRPISKRLLAWFPLKGEVMNSNLMALVICSMLLLGACTFQIGIFAIFGGFAAGVLLHDQPAFVEAWRRQVGQFVMVFFLPVFFTYTGLRTNVLGLTSASDWGWLAVVVTAAVVSKLVPVYCVGRACGFDRRESTVLGVLMNTRALMELIVLNIGFDLGLIPQKIFTMLVIMAVVTTLMAGPLLKRLLSQMGHRVPLGIEA